MITCNRCLHWKPIPEYAPLFGNCKRVLDTMSQKMMSNEFCVENDGTLEEASYLITGHAFGCILGIEEVY